MADRTRQTPKSTSHARRKWYVFALACLTVFLVGLALWRSPIRGYVATCGVVVEFESGGENRQSESAGPIDWRERIASDVSVKTAILTTNAAYDSTDDVGLRGEVQRLQNAVQVHTSSGRQPNQTRIEITVVGQTSREATQIADQLAKQFVAHENRAAQSNAWQAAAPQQQTNAEIDDARKAEQAAWNQFVATIGQQFDQLTRLVDSFQQAESVTEPSRTAQWVRLNERIAELTAQRTELLDRKLTELHPQVRDLASQIEQLKDQLSRTPKFAAVASNPPKPPNTKFKGLADQVATLITTFEDLQAQSNEARQERETIEIAVEATEQQTATRSISAARIDEPARLTRRLGGLPPLGRMMLLGFVGLIAGGVMTWATGLQKAGTLTTIASVEQFVPAPIVGVISSSEGAGFNNRRAAVARGARIATIACEATLALFVIGLLLVALIDSPLTTSFLSDPLGTVSESLSRFPNP